MADVDVVAAWSLLAIVFAVAMGYGARALTLGRAHDARVDRDGGSKLLGKRVMEMAYWSLQPVGRSLARAGITPNHVTAASLVFAAGAGVALARGHFGIAALLAAIAALGDAIDGLLARATGTASDAGEIFDASVDRYSEFFFLAGLAIAYRANLALLAIVLAAILGSFMVSYATAKAEAMALPVPRGSMRRAERALYLTLGAGLSPIFAHAVAARDASGIWLDAPMIAALLLVAIVANVSAVARLAALGRLARERSAHAPSLPPDAITPTPDLPAHDDAHPSPR